MTGVSAIDSAGIRALVRGHTSAQRASGSLRLAGARPAVKRVLELSHVASVFEQYDSVEAARYAALPWRHILVAIGGIILCTGDGVRGHPVVRTAAGFRRGHRQPPVRREGRAAR